jgi:outer membrane receptor for monomeric catechols
MCSPGALRIDAFGDFKIENMARYGRTTNGYINTSISRFTRGVNDPVAPGMLDYRLQTSRAGWQEIDFFADRLNIMAGSFTLGGMKHALVTGVEFTTYTVDNRFGSLNRQQYCAIRATTTAASGYAYAIAGAPNCINGTGTVLNAWCITDGKGTS